MTKYHKAIRDKIPEIIKKDGYSCNVKTLSDDEFLVEIEKKLSEEVAEYQNDKNPEELADIIEVIYRIAQLKGISKEELKKIRIKKVEKRGVFEKNLFLIDTSKTDNLELIKIAEEFAKKKHKGQFRKDGITPYSKHLQDVVNELKNMGISDEDILCTGWIHDTIEDTDTDYDEIYKKFNKKIADYVASVTKDTRLIKAKQEKAYISQLKKSSWQAKVVKLGDVIANFKDLANSGYDFTTQKNKVKSKITYVMAIKSGISANKKKIPQLETVQLNLNELLKKYGRKPILF